MGITGSTFRVNSMRERAQSKQTLIHFLKFSVKLQKFSEIHSELHSDKPVIPRADHVHTGEPTPVAEEAEVLRSSCAKMWK